MKFRTRYSWFLITTFFFLAPGQRASAQSNLINIAKPPPEPKGPTADKAFTPAKVEEKEIYSLDQGRKVKLMDANPDGSHWFVVDEFANWQQVTIDGHLFPSRFHEIPNTGIKLSPGGDYLIWTGLMHGYTDHGFDSTMTYLYKDTSLIGTYLSDYPAIEFSPSGKRWAALLPYAYETQKNDRDFVIVDGKLAHQNEVHPHQFSFSHDERHWAYRATDGLLEKLVTDQADTTMVLYKRHVPNSTGSTWDPTVWRYTPDVTYFHKMLEGRDYDFDFQHVARQYRTAYSSLSSDTARTYISYGGKNEGLFRWMNNVLLDDSGHHVAYLAADPKIVKRTPKTDERRAVVVYDDKIFAGPFPGIARLYMSPSGNHLAYTLDIASAKFYIDKKVAAKTSQILDCCWSPDESHVAFVAVGEHAKFFVACDGKRSGLFEQIGRIGWSADGKTIEFAGIRNGKLITVRQSL